MRLVKEPRALKDAPTGHHRWQDPPVAEGISEPSPRGRDSEREEEMLAMVPGGLCYYDNHSLCFPESKAAASFSKWHSGETAV